MSLSDLTNQPIEMTLSGKVLKIQRLSIRDLFGPAEAKIQADYIKNVHLMASGLVGKEKQEFMSTALKDCPKGAELDKQSLEYMSTPIGISQILMIGLNKCQAISEDEVASLMLGASDAELGFIRDYLSGDNEDKKKQRLEQENLLNLVTPIPTPTNP